MPRPKRVAEAQASLLEAHVPTAPCVPAVREAVKQWRADGYQGITDTTSILLNYWFRTDHRSSNGRAFAFHPFQRDAIETLVYLWEVAKIRRHKDLLETFAAKTRDLRLLQYDLFPRYAVKMATGSGKTKVIALAFAWQYFNAVAEGDETCARSALLIAPNVIVFERLRTDFAGGRIFKIDPIIPPELRIHWDVEFYIRGDPERASSLGAFYLTNIDQLHRDDEADDDEPDVMTAVLGPKPPANPNVIEDFDQRIVKCGWPCLVINDEAHHTHDEDSAWNNVIRRLHAELTNRPSAARRHSEGRRPEESPATGAETLRRLAAQSDKAAGEYIGLVAQLDFTATPRHQKGALFSWTIFDYPLKQAIIDNIVKRPVKGIATGIQEAKSNVASTKYKAFLTAGVERWKEYREQLSRLNKKPILFVMMNDTTEADDVADYLQKKYPEDFAGDRLLTIHTDRSGEVSKKDLDKARKVAHDVDLETSPVNAIVSVLMLREGWDVQNVTVVVGLRPYTSKANILPEQTIGRGLRLMFRGTTVGYTERVDVIGNQAFISFVEDLEKQENLKLDTFEVGKDKLQIVTIAPDPNKADKDIRLPQLSPLLQRKKSISAEIAALDVLKLPTAHLPRKQDSAEARKFKYEGYDLITLQKLIEREYLLPEAQTAQEIISYYAKRIAQDVKLPGQFAVIAPKVRQYLEQRAFGETVDLEDAGIVKVIGTNVAHYITVKTFVAALQPLVVESLVPALLGEGRPLSDCEPFPWSRSTYNAPKCVFNLVPCDNDFERDFAKFLQQAGDVERFGKLPQSFGFAIEYTDSSGNLRYYYPDFTAVLTNGEHFLIETKGQETTEVARKDQAATYWADNATRLTGKVWRYLKVPQKEFNQLQPTGFADLIVFASPETLI
jgi:type III restriction enzyme